MGSGIRPGCPADPAHAPGLSYPQSAVSKRCPCGFDGSSIDTRVMRPPTIGMKPSRMKNPLKLALCKRRMQTARFGMIAEISAHHQYSLRLRGAPAERAPKSRAVYQVRSPSPPIRRLPSLSFPSRLPRPKITLMTPGLIQFSAQDPRRPAVTPRARATHPARRHLLRTRSDGSQPSR